MKILWLFLWFILSLIAESRLSKEQLPLESLYPFFSGEVIVTSSETLSDSTKLVLSSFGNPLFYSREIFTEVCETEVCFPVQLTLYWDFAGSFLGFAIPAEYPVTKAGHKKFSRVDYFRLYTLLNHPDSKLAKLNKTDLVKFNNSVGPEPDAVTGETIHLSGENLVSGAAFTCYTLWNIVNAKDNFNAENFKQKIDFTSAKNLGDWQNRLKDIEQIAPGKLALLLNDGNKKRYLRKFSIQQLLTSKLDSLSPLKCLMINNYLNRQKYLYPETKDKLKQCKSIADCFNKMVPQID